MEGNGMPALFETHRAQIEAILLAWGMATDNAHSTADILAWADLHGIDSHGISMLPEYDERRRGGRLNMRAKARLIRETAVSALFDGDGGMGHVPARTAMRVAIAKAREAGLAVAAVRNSSHFGAAGYYTAMAAEAGLVAMGATSASGGRVVPTGGAAPRVGTDPWSFAAPGEPGRPFLLDMATTTVAYGKVRNRLNESQPIPVSWGLDRSGRPTTDPADVVMRGGFLTPLGGSREGSSHKGYGLAAMVNILSSCLSGSTLITDPEHTKKPQGFDIGHFFLALDPGLFRDVADFRADVTTFCDALRATTPLDPARPVQVAGDPEHAAARKRREAGIPIGPGLLEKIRGVAERCGAPWLLDRDPSEPERGAVAT
jgi:LDH2 family malate/lactate/ureidoglycolate dehydrogenase